MAGKNHLHKKQLSFFNRNVAVDMGSTQTVVWSLQRRNLLQEPSVLAIDTRYNTVYRVGKDAYQMLGKAPPYIEVIRPLQDGVVASFNYTVKMLNCFLDRVINRSSIIKHRLIMTIPHGSTQVERQALVTAAKRTGIKKVFLLEEPLAAAIGAELPVNEAKGNFLINLGGGITEMVVISLGGIVKARNLRQGGNALNWAIQRYINKKYQLQIGETTAEKAKENAGFAVDPPPETEYVLKGINRNTRKPDRIRVPYSDLTEAMQPLLLSYCNTAKKLFEQTPPQLTSDIIKEGIYLSGGGALLHNIDLLFSKMLQLPVKKVDRPFTGAAKGAGQALQYMHAHRLDSYRS